MKRLITGMVLSALICSGTVAMADATYNDSNNSVSVDASGYHAVIITNDETGDIVYVDQSDDESFSAAASFLIKAGADEGTYTVLLGGKDGSTQPVSYTFSITKAVTPEPKDEKANDVYEQKNADGSYDIGFGWETVEMSNIKSVVLILGEKAYAYNLDTTFTNAKANVGIKIKGVTSDKYNSDHRAYLSSKTVEELGGKTTE